MTQAFPKPQKQPKASTKAERYLDWVAHCRCLRTRETPVQLHHVRGPRSFKTHQRLPRRRGPADLAVIPLSPSEHQLIHEIGEEEYGRRHLGGETAVADFALTLLAAYTQEQS